MSTLPSPAFQNVTASAIITDSLVTEGGTIDGSVIGATTPEAATFTNVNTTTLNDANYVASVVQGANVTVDNTDPRHPVISTVAGIPDAPSDGNIYGRQDAEWVVASTSSPLANPMTTPGDMIYGITAGNPARLAVGSGGQVLTVVGGLPSWQTSTALANPMTAVGDVIIGSTGGEPIRLGLGTSGQVLLSNGTTVVWGNAPTPITTAGDLIVGGSGGAPTRLGIGANGTVLGVSGGVLAYVDPGSGGGVPSVNGITGAVTLAEGANVTLTQSGDTITIATAPLPYKNFVTDFGADPTGATDSTAAWTAAVAYCIANNGLSMLAAGTFLFSGALQDTGRGNAQLLLPSRNYIADEQMTFEVFGALTPPPILSVIGTEPVPTGCTRFISNLSSGTGSFIGGWGPSGSVDDFTNILFKFHDVLVETPLNPTISAVDLSHCATVDLDGLVIAAGSYSIAGVTFPTTNTSYGLRTPHNGNGAYTKLGSINVIGFYNNIELGEHACSQSLGSWGGVNDYVFSGADHASSHQRLMSVSCVNGLTSSGVHYTSIQQYDIERYASGAYTRANDINDAPNNLHADLGWHSVLSPTGSVDTFTVVGGYYVNANEIGKGINARVVTGTTDTPSYTDKGGIIVSDNAGGMTGTIALNSAPFGAVFTWLQNTSGQVTIAAASGVTLNPSHSLLSRAEGSMISAVQIGPNLWQPFGDLQ